MAKARCSSIRLELLKIGGRVTVTTSKVWVSRASSNCYEVLFAHCYERLRHLAGTPPPTLA